MHVQGHFTLTLVYLELFWYIIKVYRPILKRNLPMKHVRTAKKIGRGVTNSVLCCVWWLLEMLAIVAKFKDCLNTMMCDFPKLMQGLHKHHVCLPKCKSYPRELAKYHHGWLLKCKACLNNIMGDIPNTRIV